MVPLSAAEFYASLEQRFPVRDGMYFLPDQVVEYDKKRMTVNEVVQSELFVSDEASAIQWLKQQITSKPQTSQDIHPQFLKEISGWKKHEQGLELSELLEQNFLRYDGQGDGAQPGSQLPLVKLQGTAQPGKRLPYSQSQSKRSLVHTRPQQGDRPGEETREMHLLREFERYIAGQQEAQEYSAWKPCAPVSN